jgi:hypothetical protein
VHADVLAGLQPVAGKAEVGPVGELEAEHLLVEVLGALEVLGDEEIMVQFGDGHGGKPLQVSVVRILALPAHQ